MYLFRLQVLHQSIRGLHTTRTSRSPGTEDAAGRAFHEPRRAPAALMRESYASLTRSRTRRGEFRMITRMIRFSRWFWASTTGSMKHGSKHLQTLLQTSISGFDPLKQSIQVLRNATHCSLKHRRPKGFYARTELFCATQKENRHDTMLIHNITRKDEQKRRNFYDFSCDFS